MTRTVAEIRNILSKRVLAETKKHKLEKITGKYKIEVRFMSDRSTHKPMRFSISVWDSGGKLHGGGDEKMYKCMRLKGVRDIMPSDLKFRSVSMEYPSVRGCGKYIPGDAMSNSRVHCTNCGAIHMADSISTNTMYSANATSAADIISKIYRELDHNCDVVSKHVPTDPRTLEMAKVSGIKSARESEGAAVKPWKSVMEEMGVGRSLEDIIRTFITS